MATEYDAAINALLIKIKDHEVFLFNEKIIANRLCVLAECSLAFPGIEAQFTELSFPETNKKRKAKKRGNQSIKVKIKSQIFAKMTKIEAITKFLEISGPSTTREIITGLMEGGYPFRSKNIASLIIGICPLIKDNPKIFKRDDRKGKRGGKVSVK